MGNREQRENEIAAKAIFEGKTFIELKTNENGMPGRVDYVSNDPGINSAMEVTTHTNEQRAKLINGTGDFSVIIPRRDLLADWVIQTRDHPHMKKINQLVIPHLHTLSIHGITEYYKSHHEWWMKNVPTLEKALSAFNSASVEYARKHTIVERDDEGIANVVLLPTLNWSFGGPNSVLEIIETNRKIFPENVRKLRESGAKLRHLFIWVDKHTDREVLDAFTGDRVEMPTRAPKLPEEITHLWIVNIETEVGWYFDPTEGWQLIGTN